MTWTWVQSPSQGGDISCVGSKQQVDDRLDLQERTNKSFTCAACWFKIPRLTEEEVWIPWPPLWCHGGETSLPHLWQVFTFWLPSTSNCTREAPAPSRGSNLEHLTSKLQFGPTGIKTLQNKIDTKAWKVQHSWLVILGNRIKKVF